MSYEISKEFDYLVEREGQVEKEKGVFLLDRTTEASLSDEDCQLIPFERGPIEFRLANLILISTDSLSGIRAAIEGGRDEGESTVHKFAVGEIRSGEMQFEDIYEALDFLYRKSVLEVSLGDLNKPEVPSDKRIRSIIFDFGMYACSLESGVLEQLVEDPEGLVSGELRRVTREIISGAVAEYFRNYGHVNPIPFSAHDLPFPSEVAQAIVQSLNLPGFEINQITDGGVLNLGRGDIPLTRVGGELHIRQRNFDPRDYKVE
jgi:hypothetical protein